MTLYYLGTPVIPTRYEHEGWLWCRWPDGREFKHWAAQLSAEPIDKNPSEEEQDG